MRLRLAIWMAAGVVIAGIWAIYVASVSPEVVVASFREPLIKALLYLSCPISYLGWHLPMRLTTVLVANGATYGLVGGMLEILRHMKHPRAAH